MGNTVSLEGCEYGRGSIYLTEESASEAVRVSQKLPFPFSIKERLLSINKDYAGNLCLLRARPQNRLVRHVIRATDIQLEPTKNDGALVFTIRGNLFRFRFEAVDDANKRKLSAIREKIVAECSGLAFLGKKGEVGSPVDMEQNNGSADDGECSSDNDSTENGGVIQPLVEGEDLVATSHLPSNDNIDDGAVYWHDPLQRRFNAFVKMNQPSDGGTIYVRRGNQR